MCLYAKQLLNNLMHSFRKHQHHNQTSIGQADCYFNYVLNYGDKTQSSWSLITPAFFIPDVK